MQMVNQQQLTLDRLSTAELKSRLGRLNSAYHITEDRQVRRDMLLLMDELKIELIKRGIYEPS
jgi:hypothetical protein